MRTVTRIACLIVLSLLIYAATPAQTVQIAAGGFVDEFRFDRDAPLKNLRGIWIDGDVKVFGPKEKGKSGFRGALAFNYQREFDRTIFEHYPMPDPLPLPPSMAPGMLPASAMMTKVGDIRRDVNTYSGGFRLSYVTKAVDPFAAAYFGRKDLLGEYKYRRAYDFGADLHFTENSPLALRAFIELEATGAVLSGTTHKYGLGIVGRF